MPALQVIALDTATPQLRAPASGDTYSAPRAVDIAPETLTGSAATSSLSIAQTWSTTGTPTAIDLNVTDTASNAASLLFRARVGGTNQATIGKNGVFGSRTFTFGEDPNQSATFFASAAGQPVFGVRASARLYIQAATNIEWGGTSVSAGDLVLARDAANTLAQRNGVNAQAFNIYNTYTDASNYERGFVRWSTNVLTIGTEAAGTGSSRPVSIITNNSTITLNVGSSYTSTARLDFSDWWGATQGSAGGVSFGSGHGIFWGSSGTNTSYRSAISGDTFIGRGGASILLLRSGTAGVGAAIETFEMTAPAAPAANGVRIYAEDNGSGKTRLMALFATGAAQQLAIEP